MKIYHFTEKNGDREYVILSEDENLDIKDNLVSGFRLNMVYNYEGIAGTLPLDRPLWPD